MLTRLPIRLFLRRNYSVTPRTNPVLTAHNFANPTLFVLDVGKRAIKFSLIGLFTLGAVTAGAYEAVHQWVETVELAPEKDGEVIRWQWDSDMEKWSGDSTAGGTDKALGLIGRHTVRAAWMAYNWGVGQSTSVIGLDAPQGSDILGGMAGLKVVNASMQKTEDFLNIAIAIANDQSRTSRLHPQTIPQLMARHGNVLERLGNDSLQTSKSQYERAFLLFSGQGTNAARIAARLGDINIQLNQTNDALSWWAKAIHITRGGAPETLEELPAVLGTAPVSPCAQRILSTTLVSLSAFYATSGQLLQAQAIEEAALDMIRSTSIQSLESILTVPPPCALHTLYLLQRSSLLSIHLAEVLHAQHKPVLASIQHLTAAAESSEKIARTLTGLPITSSERTSGNTPPSYSQLLPVYAKSRSMKKPATALLRDARRTAAEAWNLVGILSETHSKDPRIAFQYYERAIQWAGVQDPQSGTLHAAEGILESDWVTFRSNYARTKQLVEQNE